MLDLLHRREEPDAEPPLVVVSPRSGRRRPRRLRRRRPKKYCLASVEEPASSVVLLSDDQAESLEELEPRSRGRPTIVIKQRPSKLAGLRHCVRTCCKTILDGDCEDDCICK